MELNFLFPTSEGLESLLLRGFSLGNRSECFYPYFLMALARETSEGFNSYLLCGYNINKWGLNPLFPLPSAPETSGGFVFLFPSDFGSANNNFEFEPPFPPWL